MGRLDKIITIRSDDELAKLIKRTLHLRNRMDQPTTISDLIRTTMIAALTNNMPNLMLEAERYTTQQLAELRADLKEQDAS